MLRVVRAQSGRRTTAEFSNYVPFKFRSDAHHHDPKLYWRTGSFVSQMLEVEIDRTTGEVIGVVLLLPGIVNRAFPEINVPADRMASGYPVVDISDWPADRVRDEPGPMSVHVDASRMLIRLCEVVEIASVVGTRDVMFELDGQDAIVGILIIGLPKQKIDEFADMHMA